MKDIGSIFPLYNDETRQTLLAEEEKGFKNVIYYSLCRESFYAIANSLIDSCKTVLLPAYTCDTVVAPFRNLNWDCFFFPVDKSLRIVTSSVRDICAQQRISLIVVHPYYGMDLNEEELSLLNELHDRGCKVVVDYTQCIFSTQNLDFVDYCVGSYRKWLAIPDGAFLKSRQGLEAFEIPISENRDFVSPQSDAMYLRGLYFESGDEEIKSISRRINGYAENLANFQTDCYRMSVRSVFLMDKEDKEFIEARRMENYRYLYGRLQHQDGISLVCKEISEVTTAPLYFPIYSQDRYALQSALAAEHVYAPVIWPVEDDRLCVNDTVKVIFDTILAIPIDQRYDHADMDKIVKIISKHYDG